MRRLIVPPAMLTINWVAEHAGMDREVIYRLVRAGHIPSQKMGSQYWILLSELRSFCPGLWDSIVERASMSGFDMAGEESCATED